MITAYFSNVVYLITQLMDASTIVLALNESAKIVPYITSSRKIVKVYLKACLTLWSSGSGADADDGGDGVRVAAFLAIRRLTRGGDQAITELVLKVSHLSDLISTADNSFRAHIRLWFARPSLPTSTACPSSIS